MSDRIESIQKHTSDMLAVEAHILEAVERQRESEVLRKSQKANELIIRIERTLKAHVAALEGLRADYDAEAQSTIKRAITEALGIAAGLYDKLREHTVSRMLRDDYTALSLAAMSYTAFHTFGLVINEPRVADLALAHLEDLTPLLVELSKVLPEAVAQEVQEENAFAVDVSKATLAVANTQETWRPEVTRV